MFKLFLFSLFVLFSHNSRAEMCPEFNLEKAAWNFTASEFKVMTSDSTLEENKGLKHEEKIERVSSRIAKYHKKMTDGQIQEFAESIIKITDCTGLDFSMFTAVLEVESSFCKARKNSSSGASGCGQFKPDPILVFKNHLLLPHRIENGDPDLKKAMETLLSRCYGNETNDIDYFKKVFSGTVDEVQGYFQKGKNLKLDKIASAIFLKFYYAKSGFYYDPNVDAPGALSRYGGSSGYGSKTNSLAQEIDSGCTKNTDYLKEIEKVTCEISEDPDACDLTTPTFDI